MCGDWRFGVNIFEVTWPHGTILDAGVILPQGDPGTAKNTGKSGARPRTKWFWNGCQTTGDIIRTGLPIHIYIMCPDQRSHFSASSHCWISQTTSISKSQNDLNFDIHHLLNRYIHSLEHWRTWIPHVTVPILSHPIPGPDSALFRICIVRGAAWLFEMCFLSAIYWDNSKLKVVGRDIRNKISIYFL